MGPSQPGDLASPEAGFDRQQDDDAVAGGVLMPVDVIEHRLQHCG